MAQSLVSCFLTHSVVENGTLCKTGAGVSARVRISCHSACWPLVIRMSVILCVLKCTFCCLGGKIQQFSVQLYLLLAGNDTCQFLPVFLTLC